MEFQFSDGGRQEAGFKGEAGDCVVRAIAIAAQLPYMTVYNELKARNQAYAQKSRSQSAKSIAGKGATPRDGNFKQVFGPYIVELGFKWVPTMAIGQGCTVHLKSGELPAKGRLICSVSKHVCAVVDNVILDTHDCSRDGTRCVYGYWIKL
jgi:hypothetical protein